MLYLCGTWADACPWARGTWFIIRTLTRENFYDMMVAQLAGMSRYISRTTISRTYKMVQNKLGDYRLLLYSLCRWLSLPNHQLLPAAWQRIWNNLTPTYWKVALSKGLSKIRLRVFEQNRAQSLYQRVGYIPLLVDEYSLMLMEKIL